MDEPTLRDWILFGGLGGTMVAIWKLFDRVRQSGAQEQSVRSRLDTLETGIAERRSADKKLFDRLDDLKETLGEIKLKMVEDHSALSERLIKLEATGCKPTRKE